MNKLLTITLVSAIFATTGFAAGVGEPAVSDVKVTLNGNTTIKGSGCLEVSTGSFVVPHGTTLNLEASTATDNPTIRLGANRDLVVRGKIVTSPVLFELPEGATNASIDGVIDGTLSVSYSITGEDNPVIVTANVGDLTKSDFVIEGNKVVLKNQNVTTGHIVVCQDGTLILDKEDGMSTGELAGDTDVPLHIHGPSGETDMAGTVDFRILRQIPGLTDGEKLSTAIDDGLVTPILSDHTVRHVKVDSNSVLLPFNVQFIDLDLSAATTVKYSYYQVLSAFICKDNIISVGADEAIGDYLAAYQANPENPSLGVTFAANTGEIGSGATTQINATNIAPNSGELDLMTVIADTEAAVGDEEPHEPMNALGKVLDVTEDLRGTLTELTPIVYFSFGAEGHTGAGKTVTLTFADSVEGEKLLTFSGTNNLYEGTINLPAKVVFNATNSFFSKGKVGGNIHATFSPVPAAVEGGSVTPIENTISQQTTSESQPGITFGSITVDSKATLNIDGDVQIEPEEGYLGTLLSVAEGGNLVITGTLRL